MAMRIVEAHGVIVLRRYRKEDSTPTPKRGQPGRYGERTTFPIEPLEQLLGHPGTGQLTGLLRCGGDEVRTARTWGWSWRQADRYAVRAGFHPGTVWPDLWWSTVPGDEHLAIGDAA